MKFSLNVWQRLWLVILVVLFIIMALTLAASAWPAKDPRIVADMVSPACKGWTELPVGFFPEKYPVMGEKCYALQAFIFSEQTNVKTPEDYERFLANSRIKTLVKWLLIWIGTMFWLYVIGWAAGWVTGFRKPPEV